MNDKRAIEIADITGIMKTEGGRSFMARMLRQWGCFSETFHIDPLHHAYQAGRRSAALNLVNELKHAAPGEYQQLLKEHFYD
jgi:hypothetical protein